MGTISLVDLCWLKGIHITTFFTGCIYEVLIILLFSMIKIIQWDLVKVLLKKMHQIFLVHFIQKQKQVFNQYFFYIISSLMNIVIH